MAATTGGGSSIQEQQDQQRGRHLVTSLQIQPGSRVLCESAASAVLYDSEVPRRCHLSFEIAQTPLRCGGCKHARYANKQNQRSAWSSGHREECAALAACRPHVPPPTVRLLAKLFWRQTWLKPAGQPAFAKAQLRIESLEHHWVALPDSKKETYAQMAALTRHYMQSGRTNQADLPDPKIIALMLARCACNNHTICDDELRPIGVGLFPTGALINHSCTPNAIQSFKQQQIIFTALQSIAPGAEISISYIELAATRAERQQQLLEQYYFDIDSDLQGGRPGAKPLLKCTAGHICAEAYSSAPDHMGPADHALTGARMTSGSAVDGHVMAFARSAPANADQESFPCSSAHDSHDDGANDDSCDVSAGRGLQAASDAASASSSLTPGRLPQASSAQQPIQDLVHLHCWGAGFAGVDQQQLLALARHMAHMLLQHKACLQSLSSQDPDRAKSLALSALQLADHMPAPVKALGSHHIWRMRVQEALMRACVDLGNDWPMVLSVGKKLVPVYELVYPKVWLNKGLHFAMLAKVSALLERNQEAMNCAKQALQQLQYTHSDTLVMEEVRQIMFESGRSPPDTCA